MREKKWLYKVSSPVFGQRHNSKNGLSYYLKRKKCIFCLHFYRYRLITIIHNYILFSYLFFLNREKTKPKLFHELCLSMRKRKNWSLTNTSDKDYTTATGPSWYTETFEIHKLCDHYWEVTRGVEHLSQAWHILIKHFLGLFYCNDQL